jgi:hypothetical protein
MVISRRTFLQGAASIAAAGLARRAAGQSADQGPSFGRPHLRPLKEFRGAFLQAVSADGREICVVPGSDGVEVWTYRDGQLSQEIAGTILQGDSLCVIELGSWKMMYSTKLQAAPFIVSFFRDTAELYVVTEGSVGGGKFGEQQIVIDLSAGKIKQEQERAGLFQTTSDQRLLTAVGELGKGGVLRVVELPDYREVTHADLEVPRSGRSGTDQVVSSRGDSLVYGVDDTLVCRRTDDLGILWTRKLGTTSSRVWRVAISATGGRVAAVAAAAPRPESPEAARRPLVLQPLYIAVYDGRSGAPLARFPADVHFDQALALSPDGKLLAVGQRAPSGDGQNVDLLVDIYDIASGDRVARELHCRVPPGRYQNLSGSFGPVAFTADGRYLVTSGYDRTKIWEITI